MLEGRMAKTEHEMKIQNERIAEITRRIEHVERAVLRLC